MKMMVFIVLQLVDTVSSHVLISESVEIDKTAASIK